MGQHDGMKVKNSKFKIDDLFVNWWRDIIWVSGFLESADDPMKCDLKMLLKLQQHVNEFGNAVNHILISNPGNTNNNVYILIIKIIIVSYNLNHRL